MDEAVRETWAKRVERWKDSGLTAKEFSAETGINARSLSWWRWRLSSGEPTSPRKRRRSRRSREADLTKAATAPLAFVEMTAAVVREPIEIVLPSMLRVRVPTGFDDATLARLLDMLERRR
jgi:hypothetical protein